MSKQMMLCLGLASGLFVVTGSASAQSDDIFAESWGRAAVYAAGWTESPAYVSHSVRTTSERTIYDVKMKYTGVPSGNRHTAMVTITIDHKFKRVNIDWDCTGGGSYDKRAMQRLESQLERKIFP